MTLLLLVGVLVAVEFALFARPVIAALYGDRYAQGAAAARLVVVAECIGAHGRLAFTALVAMGRHRLYPLATLTGLLVNVGLNLWLIPAYSYWGAAIATLVTEVLVVAVLWVPMARLDVLRPFPRRPFWGAALAGGAAAAVGAWAGSVGPWPVAAVAVAATYLVLLHVGRVPGPDGLLSFGRDLQPRPQGAPA
jgi:O-antigen/teichoic acid export membrane protein